MSQKFSGNLLKLKLIIFLIPLKLIKFESDPEVRIFTKDCPSVLFQARYSDFVAPMNSLSCFTLFLTAHEVVVEDLDKNILGL
jgi:hypothetical protein